MWERALASLPKRQKAKLVAVGLFDLTPNNERQLDFFIDQDPLRDKWKTIATLTDRLNNKYGRTVLSLGSWRPPPGGYAGGKISYTRIPSMEDFW